LNVTISCNYAIYLPTTSSSRLYPYNGNRKAVVPPLSRAGHYYRGCQCLTFLADGSWCLFCLDHDNITPLLPRQESKTRCAFAECSCADLRPDGPRLHWSVHEDNSSVMHLRSFPESRSLFCPVHSFFLVIEDLTTRYFSNLIRTLEIRQRPAREATLNKSRRVTQYQATLARPRTQDARWHHYLPLDRTTNDIRLLTILPDKPSAGLRTLIDTVHLSRNVKPQYEALSYTTPGLSHNLVDIKVHLYIAPSNKLRIKGALTLNLMHLRYEYKPRRLWVDVICVDQSKMEERGQQVRRMRDMFKVSHLVRHYLPCT